MKTSGKLSQISFIIAREFRAISTSYAVLLVLMGGIFVYGLLYNYMYAPNIVTDAPVAVVDNSHSSLSRQYIRWLDATPQVAVYAQAMDYREAREWMKEGKVQGILYIPHDFETRVFQGREAVFSLYATTDAFLYFEALQEATSRVYLAINDAHRMDGAVFLPPQGLLAVAMAKPVNVAGTALYNHTEGYGSYLIPAVMMVIIFQTLLMVIGMLTGDEYQHRATEPLLPGGRTADKSGLWGGAMRLVAGKTFVYCGLYITPLLQHSQYRKRTVHYRYDGTLSDGDLFLRAGSLALLHRFGSSAADDRFLLGRLDFPVRSLLPAGTDAMVLAHGTLHPPGRTRHACFRQAKLDGSRYGRHTAGIHYTVDTGDRLFRAQRVGIQEKAGSVNQKREPFPNSEITPMCPPIFSIMLLHRGSPNPVPCTKLSTFIKRSKTAS